MKPNKDLQLSGQILYMRENTKELKEFKIVILLLFAFLIVSAGYIYHYRVIAYPVGVIRENTATMKQLMADKSELELVAKINEIQRQELTQCEETIKYFADKDIYCQDFKDGSVGLYREVE